MKNGVPSHEAIQHLREPVPLTGKESLQPFVEALERMVTENLPDHRAHVDACYEAAGRSIADGGTNPFLPAGGVMPPSNWIVADGPRGPGPIIKKYPPLVVIALKPVR